MFNKIQDLTWQSRWHRFVTLPAVLLALLFSTGCVNNPSQTVSCMELHCIKNRIIVEQRNTCLRDLFSYERHRQHQAAIDARYNYPLQSSANYSEWRRLGGIGPSPVEWCQHYAEWTTRTKSFAKSSLTGQ